MTGSLWTFDELVGASGGRGDGVPAAPISGCCIDTRTLQAGDLFIALKDQRDGHDFVSAAFAKGAAAALVSDGYERKPGEGALIRVGDTLKGLQNIGRAARRRLSADARVIGVTGSVGKTGTKEMLRACLARLGETHAADKSFNNHWGVPLTLARMPASTRYGVFEIGMNHAGEITPLTRMVRPHVAIITTVEAVHLEFFASVAAIAEAKSEIFLGLEKGGVAVINRDNPYFDIMDQRAREAGAVIRTFGLDPAADFKPSRWDIGTAGSVISIPAHGRDVTYRVGAPGAHIAHNSLALVAALDAVGADLDAALPALADMTAPQGRGARLVLGLPQGKVLLIDESYNANPASMRSALAAMATVPRAEYGRRIAVMGDMLELGPDGPRLHADLKEAVDASGVDLVFASGPGMAHLFRALPESRRGAWANGSDGIQEAVIAAVRAGDVVMIKGSLGSLMAPIVEALKRHHGRSGR